MKTRTFTMEIPAEIDDREMKEWALVKVQRFLTVQEQAKQVSVEAAVKTLVDEVREKNKIAVVAEPAGV